MDAIQYITEDFTITVTGKKTGTTVTAVINESFMDMECRSVDITKTSLGRLLALEAVRYFVEADTKESL